MVEAIIKTHIGLWGIMPSYADRNGPGYREHANIQEIRDTEPALPKEVRNVGLLARQRTGKSDV